MFKLQIRDMNELDNKNKMFYGFDDIEQVFEFIKIYTFHSNVLCTYTISRDI